MSNLIERYVHEVTRQLPQNQRKDVAMELTATIEDMVGEKKEASAVAIKNVLTELGDPTLLASQYTNTKQYLIGPKWFELYKKVLIVVLQISLPIAAILLFVAKLTAGPGNLVDTAISAVAALINVGVMSIFWVTGIFALIERFELDVPELDQKWSPDDLPKLPKARQVSIMDSLLEIFTSVISLGFASYALNLPLFNIDVWQPILLAAMAISLIELVHQLFMLRWGNWTLPLLSVQIFTSIALILTAIVFGTAPNLLDSKFIANLKENGLANADQLMNWVVYVIALSIILICVWQIVDAIRLHLKLRSKSS